MFVAWRDLRFARGRFALIVSVVVLITLLVGLLGGLMAGLRGQSVSAIEGIPADRIVFAAPAEGADLSYNDSAISADQYAAWRDAGGTVQPIGIAMDRIATGQVQVSASLFGVQPGFAEQKAQVAPRQPGAVVLSRGAADEIGVAAGDTVTIAGTAYTVSDIAGDAWFSHTPVVWMHLTDWQRYAQSTGQPDAVATVLAITGIGADRITQLNQQAHTVTTSVSGSFDAVSGFRSEQTSLKMMLYMLLLISALVIGAFFTVWTIQRGSDIAILKALGASTPALLRDALGQALVVLAVGVGVGIVLTAGLGQVAGKVVPFVFGPQTILLPDALMIALGLTGAAFALRSIVTTDPLTAIGSNR